MSSHDETSEHGQGPMSAQGNFGRPSPQIQHVPRREVTELAQALVDCIAQTVAGDWIVNAEDPEQLVCDLATALSLPQPGGWRPSREDIAKELIAHGEFSALGEAQNYANALKCADELLSLPPVPTDGGNQDNTVSSSSLPAHVADATATEAQRALDLVWRQIDALGGVHSEADRESGFADAYDAALNAACEVVERLGGRKN